MITLLTIRKGFQLRLISGQFYNLYIHVLYHQFFNFFFLWENHLILYYRSMSCFVSSLNHGYTNTILTTKNCQTPLLTNRNKNNTINILSINKNIILSKNISKHKNSYWTLLLNFLFVMLTEIQVKQLVFTNAKFILKRKKIVINNYKIVI